MTRTLSSSVEIKRDPELKWTDIDALRAIAQAAVDVELFTIPLYMTSLYSIEGMHPITGRNSQLYQGRMWPGAKVSADPQSANAKAFNIIFSVFIQEMLHLQMAANMATVIGVKPDFTSAALQDGNHGWTCYGPDKTVIPNIVDLRDTRYKDVKVDIGPLDKERVELFLAIEQPEEQAKAAITGGNYFPTVPFEKWKPGDPLPMFGTIGHMYQCYLDYLHLSYSDDTSLWQSAFDPNAIQNDIFNAVSGGHPMREFLGFDTRIATTYPDIALKQMIAMMDAITDQGEGSELKKPTALLKAVKPKYQPDRDALRSDYPSYDDKGDQVPSADAVARYDNDSRDHYERFQEIDSLLGEITTWATCGKSGNWTADDLRTADYDKNPYNDRLPTADDIAGALNRLAGKEDSHKLLSQAAIGAIAGVTTVLNDYWAPPKGGSATLFPYPSMVGSGDRMGIAWAVLGRCPDLSIGLDPIQPGRLYHACQGLDFAGGGNDCAAIEIYHSCKGSNACQAQGGCGFVQKTSGGGNCGGSASTSSGGGNCSTALSLRSFAGRCGGPPPPPTIFYSAPSDNKCNTLGGCAVPISASQLYPTEGVMQIFDFERGDDGFNSDPICRMRYKVGDPVHDVAWRAFSEVMAYRQEKGGEKPKPNDLRLAFPPST